VRLLEVGAGSALVGSPLRVEEQVLHHLLGVNGLDQRMAELVSPVVSADELLPSHVALAAEVVSLLARVSQGESAPLVQLAGPYVEVARAIAATASRQVGLGLAALPAHGLPALPQDLNAFLRLWLRQAALSPTALLVEGHAQGGVESVRLAGLAQLAQRLPTPLFLAVPERMTVPGCRAVTFEIGLPTSDEQEALWRHALGGAGEGLNGTVAALSSQFSLRPAAIRSIAELACATTGLARASASREVRNSCAGAEGDPAISPADGSASPGAEPLPPGTRIPLARALWSACREEARVGLDSAAPRLRSGALWDDLVLPAQQKEVLSHIVAQVRQRNTVYERWGFGRTMSRGLGITALFAGPSGTGKTLAAEVLANALDLDLYQVDLSQVVSKYIGETEKNLQRVFAAAEAAGAVLLFDEADALFGKRSVVRDSHDRYANLEVSYLLQRMEAYRSLAILTTNMKEAIDPAFMRRIRFVVSFPFPDAVRRREIWQRVFPAQTPTEALEWAKLARLNASGGHIRNIALNAAFLAADEGTPVRMGHVLRAAHAEAIKLERPLSETEIGGWLS
jgi:hypothetical protein